MQQKVDQWYLVGNGKLDGMQRSTKNTFGVENLHNPLRQPHPPEGREQKQEKLQSCSLWNKKHIHRKIDKMKRQRAMYQMKEQDKTPETQLNEVEIGNLPEKEFRIMIVKMIQDLGKRMEAKIEKMQEMFNKDLEELKNKQTEMNNTITT